MESALRLAERVISILASDKYVGNARDKLLRILLNHYAPAGAPAVAFLWTQDRIALRVGLTLWSVVTTGPTTVSDHDKPRSLRVIHPVKHRTEPVDASVWYPLITAHDGADARINSSITAIWHRNSGERPHELFIPLRLPGSSEATTDDNVASIGIIQLLLPPASYSTPPLDEADALGVIIASQVQLERRRRAIRAIEEFQREVSNLRSQQSICLAAARTLLKYASSSHCVIYAQGRNRRLDKIVDTAAQPATEQMPYESVTGRIFHLPTQLGQQRVYRFADLHDTEEIAAAFDPPILPAREDYESFFNIKPLSALFVQVTCPAGPRSNVPLLIIKLLTSPNSSFLGGSFSYTDELISRRIARFIGQLLPGVILQERSELLSTSPNMPRATMLSGSEVRVDEIFRKFPRDAYEAIPAVEQSWAARRSTPGNKEVTTWIPHTANAEEHAPPLDDSFWKAISQRGRYHLRVGSRQFLIEPVLQHREQSMALVLEVTTEVLPVHCDVILRLIAAEMQLRAIGRLDVAELIREINEITHAMNSSMTGVIGHAETASEMYEFAETLPLEGVGEFLVNKAKFRKSVEDLMLCLAQMKRFFGDSRFVFLDLRRSQLRLSRFSPGDIVRRLGRIMRPELERRALQLQIEDEYPSDIPFPIVDQNLIEHAIVDLLDNAIKYSHRENQIHVRIWVRRRSWYLSVLNTGRHIPPEDIPRIFEPHVRLPAGRGEQGMPGTGLGLPAALRIVRLHDRDGQIHVRSALSTRPAPDQVPKAQTLFTIELNREIPGALEQ